MLMRALCILLFLTLTTYAQTTKQASVDIEGSLFPVGSIAIHSDTILGKGVKRGNKYEAEKLEVPIRSLKTGIDLRNEHMWKRLEGGGQYTQITVMKVRAENG